MKKELMKQLEKKAWEVAQSRSGKYAIHRVEEILALGDLVALVKLRKNHESQPVFVLFYYVADTRLGWVWFIPKEEHVGGLEQFCLEYRKQFKKEYSIT